jgi:TonB family protein
VSKAPLPLLLYVSFLFLVSACYVSAQSSIQKSSVVTKSEKELLENRTNWSAPTYPPIARIAGAGGPVVVEVVIDEQGNVASARVVSGHPLLQAATLQSVRTWKFTPARVNNVPVRMSGRLTHNFPLARKPKEKTTAELEREVKDRPNDSELRYDLGVEYLKSTSYNAAVLQFLAAIRLKPDFVDAYLKLGHAYSRLYLFEKALLAFNDAARLNPGSSEAFHAIGLTNIQLGKYEPAILALKHSLELEDPITTSYFLLGKCYLLLARRDEAVLSYKEGLAKYPDSDMGHFGLGEVYLELEKYADAITEFREAIKLSTGQGLANSHFYLGLAYLGKGEGEAAMKEYEILKRLNEQLAALLLQKMRGAKKRAVESNP